MSTTHYDYYADHDKASFEPHPPDGEFPKPSSFNMRPGRYDVHFYNKNVERYRSHRNRGARALISRFLDSRILGVRIGSIASPIILMILVVLTVVGGLSLVANI